MNQHQHFDEHIKDQFAGYTAKVPGGTWENIEKRRGKKKPGAWWFLAGRTNLLVLFLLLAGGSGAWLYIDHKNKNEQDKNNSIAANTTAKKNNYRQRTNETDLPNEDTTRAGQPTETNNNQQSTSPVTNAEQQTKPLAINAKKPGRTGNYTVSIPRRNNPNTSTAYNNKDDEAAGFAKNRKRATTKGKRRIRISNALPVETGTEEEGEDPVSTVATSATDGSLWRRLRGEAERATAKGKAKQQPPIPLLAPNFLPGCPTIEKNASGNKKYFEVYAGPDYSFRSFSSIGDTASASYLKKIKESTRYASAYSAGIRYTKVFNNSMSIRAGFNYSQINEKFSIVQGNVVQVTYIINNNGDTTGSFSTTGTRIKTTHNKYRSIDIPLSIGYELGNGRWHANINAGAMINLYSWQKGELLDTAFKPVSITTGKGAAPYQFKTNMGIGFLGGISVYYRLSNNWHLVAEPWFRYNLSPMNKESSNLKQRYHTLGIRLGVRLDIP